MFFQQSEATAAQRRFPFVAVDDTDGKTAEPGLTFSGAELQVSKNGAAYASFAGTVTEKTDGSYTYEATAAELDTLGYLEFKIEKTGVRTTVMLAGQVVPWDPYLDFTAPITAIKAKTDNLPADPADASDVAAALATIQADTDNIQTRLPAALVSGRMDASVGAMAADVVTGDALATTAVDEIAARLITDHGTGYWGSEVPPLGPFRVAVGSAIRTIYFWAIHKTTGARLADADVAGLINIWVSVNGGAGSAALGTYGPVDDADIPGLQYYALHASEVAAAQNLGITFIPDDSNFHVCATSVEVYSPGAGAGDATLANQVTMMADLDNLQTRVPAALVSGRMDSSVGAMAANVVTAAATAADFSTETAASVWGALIASYMAAGTFGELTQVIGGLLHLNTRLDNTTYNGNSLLTAARLRVFASASAANAASDGSADDADSEVQRYTIVGTDEGAGKLGSYKLVKAL